jgi:hypothetical protein
LLKSFRRKLLTSSLHRRCIVDAPMLTPRHAVGAVTIGDWIYCAGDRAITGGAVQSAINEAFTLTRERA